MIDLHLKDLFRKKIQKTSSFFFKPYPEQKRWARWVFDFSKKGVTKLLMGARGYGKTETVLFYALIQQLQKNPQITVLLVTRKEDRAREIIESLGIRLQSLGFEGVFQKKSIRLKANIEDKNPTIKALTVNSTSFKGHHVDFVIMDDPLDPTDEFSVQMQKRVMKVYQELQHIARQGLIVIGQPVCEGDLYSHLRNLAGGVELMESWHGSIPTLDKPLEQLLAAGSTQREIQKNYFGILVNQSTFPFLEIQMSFFQPQRASRIFGFIDPSFKGNDFTAFCLGYIQDEYVIVEGHLYAKSWVRAWKDIFEVAQTYTDSRHDFYYEDNGLGDALYLYSNRLFKPVGSRGKKESRISRLEGLVASGHLRISPSSDSDFVHQVRHWSPLGVDHDDAPDSMASLLKVMGLL